MDNAFICTRICGGEAERNAFDGFQILANPLGGNSTADRERRVFKGRDGSPGVTYASHSISLAQREGARTFDRDLFILMENGSGRSVLKVPMIYDQGASRDALLSLPEPVLYGLLYSIWQTADNARSEAISQTSQRWGQAIADKRIRRRKGRIEIVEQWEADMKARRKAELA